MKKLLLISAMAIVLCGCHQSSKVFEGEGCEPTKFFTRGGGTANYSEQYWVCPDGEHYTSWMMMPKYLDKTTE